MNSRVLSFRRVALVLVAILVSWLVFAVFRHFTTQKLTVSCENCTASVFEEEDFTTQKYDKGKSLKNGQSIRLKKGNYIIGYQGDKGFSDGNESLVLGGAPQTINIRAPYSPERLSEILIGEKQKIDSVLVQSFSPTISQYTISEGQLLGYGDWYATTLVYNGNDAFNADSLRVIMKKDGSGNWHVESGRPEIVVSKSTNKNIPEGIIDSANQLQTPLADKFLSEQDRQDVNQ